MRATGSDKALHDLNPKQVRAVRALSTGASHEEAAAAAGTHRVTVTRWVNHHPAFIAEMNRLRQDEFRSHQAGLERVTRKAVAAIEKAVEGGDVQTALRWLRMALPVLAAERTMEAPTDSRDVLDSYRKTLPSGLDLILQTNQECTHDEAVSSLLVRLADIESA